MPSEPGAQIDIATLPNLRDLGGWPTRDGRRVRRNLLFRSTDLDGLDADGSAALARLSLRTVVDLRTAGERQARPDRLPDGATQIVCDVLADETDLAPAQLRKVLADPRHAADLLGGADATARFERGYRDIVGCRAPLPPIVGSSRPWGMPLSDRCCFTAPPAKTAPAGPPR